MTSATKKILDDALALPEKEREALVEALSDSLDPETIELHPDWTNEIRNRIAQIESGEAETMVGATARAGAAADRSVFS